MSDRPTSERLTNDVRLPALDGRTPLAFLAAVGVLRLLTRHVGEPHARLSWSPRDCTARLHSRSADVDQLAEVLHAVVRRIPEGGVLPMVPADLPPPGEAPDRLRATRKVLTELAAAWTASAYADPEATDADPEATDAQRTTGVDRLGEVDAWLAGLVTDLGLDGRGRAGITLLAAPSGKQSMRTMLQKSLQAVQEDSDLLRQALVGWRRYPGVTGEYLDHRVVFDAADAPDGRPRERGVPGATWLAVMAFPALPTTAVNGRAITAGWHRCGSRASDRRLVYPLWSRPLDLPAVVALLRHPLMADAVDGQLPDAARAFSVFRICRGQRRRLVGRTFAGVLAPLP